jgi:hypothetical protein
MTQHSHSQHRPPAGQDAEHAGRPPTSLGQIYPTYDIVGVMPDKAAGEQALQELKNVGVPEGDMDLLDPERVVQAERDRHEQQSILQRLAALVSAEEGSYSEEYQEEARDGRWLIAVHAESPDTTARVRDILKAHGATRLRHYMPHTVEDL